MAFAISDQFIAGRTRVRRPIAVHDELVYVFAGWQRQVAFPTIRGFGQGGAKHVPIVEITDQTHLLGLQKTFDLKMRITL